MAGLQGRDPRLAATAPLTEGCQAVRVSGLQCLALKWSPVELSEALGYSELQRNPVKLSETYLGYNAL